MSASPSPANKWLPLLYGASTVFFLWAVAGGNLQLFRQRLWLFAAVAALFLIGVDQIYRLGLRKRIRPQDRRELLIGLGTGLGLFAPTGAFLLLLRGGHLPLELDLPLIPGLDLVVGLGLVLPVLAETFVRGWLAPIWGWSGVAFLDALVLGFGFQSGFVFVTQWILGLALGGLTRRVSLSTAVLARVTWTILTLLLLWMQS